MVVSLADVIPAGYILCRKCAHPRHFDACRFVEAHGYRGGHDKPPCRCGEAPGSSKVAIDTKQAGEKMNTPRRRLVRRAEARS